MLDAPLLVDDANAPPLDLRWRGAEASASFWTYGLDRLRLAAAEPEVALAQPAAARLPLFRAGDVAANLWRHGDDLAFYATSDDSRLVGPGTPANLPPFDAALDFTVAGAADWLSGGMPTGTVAQALSGHSGKLNTLRIDFDGAGAELSGTYSFGVDGELSGDFKLAVAEPERLAGLIGKIAPDNAGMANSLASAVSFAGRPVNGRSVLDVRVRDGNLSVGVFPIGKLPPLS